jgi:hypothetical protein
MILHGMIATMSRQHRHGAVKDWAINLFIVEKEATGNKYKPGIRVFQEKSRRASGSTIKNWYYHTISTKLTQKCQPVIHKVG